MSESVQNGSSQIGWTLPPDPHDGFQELCALSTTGELTTEERARLTEHLAHCAACREAKQEYEGVIATVIPALASEAAPEQDGESAPGSWSIEQAEAALMESLRAEPAPAQRKMGGRPKLPAWRYAAAASILAACSLTGYWIGSLREHRSAVASAPPTTSLQRTPPQVTQPAASAAPIPAKRSGLDDNVTAKLRAEVREGQQETARLNGQLGQLASELAERSAQLDRSQQQWEDLNQQLTRAHADAESLQARLTLIGGQTAEDRAQSLALKTQVYDLSTAIEAKDREIAREQELLQHDRDIRNLIGARNLYIAEIYDVAKNGDTQKPFGRVFYTKDKSLIFYGYDLDQQHGVKNASVFQAWGGRGVDRQHAVSLGLLYQDDANQKRWVLKFNDAKTISEIDAVFVTVEPEGGSVKPTGRPLLFTYLRLDPNHP
ncbi:MAG TPA: zf-HC2 domain-containing protein [Terracidiphilus sp.]|jgi:hypothetical protein|nr:zf-HC2 domain-containing protein [Terracidiphilus sp.]